MIPEDIKVGTVFVNKTDGKIYTVNKVEKDLISCESFFYPSPIIVTKSPLITNKDLDEIVDLQGERPEPFKLNFRLNTGFHNHCIPIFIPNKEETEGQQGSDLILPPYYATDTPYEPFKIGDFYNMNIREFSALKYLLRSKDQNKRVEDLKKAITCIHKEIIRLESLKE